MFHSRLAEATLIGCLTALASFCALSARAGETYSIVAQSNRSSAATGRRPLSERIAAANLPIITQSAVTTAQGTMRPNAAPRPESTTNAENMSVAAVRVDQLDKEVEEAPAPRPASTPPVLWPFGTKRTPATAQRPTPTGQQPVASGKAADPARQPLATGKNQAAPREVQRQASARSSGKGLSSSSPASVTR